MLIFMIFVICCVLFSMYVFFEKCCEILTCMAPECSWFERTGWVATSDTCGRAFRSAQLQSLRSREHFQWRRLWGLLLCPHGDGEPLHLGVSRVDGQVCSCFSWDILVFEWNMIVIASETCSSLVESRWFSNWSRLQLMQTTSTVLYR